MIGYFLGMTNTNTSPSGWLWFACGTLAGVGLMGVAVAAIAYGLSDLTDSDPPPFASPVVDKQESTEQADREVSPPASRPEESPVTAVVDEDRFFVADEPAAIQETPEAREQREWEAMWPTLVFPSRPTDGTTGRAMARYDEFEDYTAFRVVLDLFTIQYRERILFGEMVLFSIEIGKATATETPPVSVNVVINVLDEFSVDRPAFIADGHRITLEKSDDGRPNSFELKTKDLLTMVNSDILRGRVGGNEIDLLPKDREALRDFASLLRP